jgi:hypothetical protein
LKAIMSRINTTKASVAQRVEESYEQVKRSMTAHAITDVCPAWLEGVDGGAIHPHECYYRAHRYAIHPARFEEGVLLVHGETGLCFGGHAWVELPDGLVFDGVFQQFYPLAVWDREAIPNRWYKFTPLAVGIITARLRKTHPGLYRWDTVLHLPWGDPANPLVIDGDMAHQLLLAQGR